jgi:hypothetical protein
LFLNKWVSEVIYWYATTEEHEYIIRLHACIVNDDDLHIFGLDLSPSFTYIITYVIKTNVTSLLYNRSSV